MVADVESIAKLIDTNPRKAKAELSTITDAIRHGMCENCSGICDHSIAHLIIRMSSLLEKEMRNRT